MNLIRNIDKWIGSYVRQEIGRRFSPSQLSCPVHIMFSCVDHYEPDLDNASADLQLQRVIKWMKEYPVLADKHKDADGKCPRHTFFYPAETYQKEHLDLLAGICRRGYGEVEVHLHHDGDTEESLMQKLIKAKKDFASHGFLGKRKLSDSIKFAFIHGNWSLNNSRSDGKWCGVNNESHVLSEAGCYADFTFPSAPSETQPKKINSIYYTSSNSKKAKTHNTGIDAVVGKFRNEDLMLIQGPLTLNWKAKKKGFFPGIENGEITGVNHPTPQRVDLWVDQGVCVKGKENWIFVKVHTHGAPEKNANALLGEPMDKMFSYLEDQYNDGKEYILHYVTAREMYNIIKAAEADEGGDPGGYRDYIIESNIKRLA